jgi:hypothetical protein
MNQKKAKSLRREARLVAEQQNIPQATDYDFKSYQKVWQSLDGKYHSYTVYSMSMKMCERSVYRELKKEFKKGGGK